MNNDYRLQVALTKCFYCGEDDKIIIGKRLVKGKSKIEEAHGKVIDYEPCNKCKEYREQGIILITYDEQLTSDMTNPYRTGGFFVVKDKAIERMFGKEFANNALEKRAGFISHEIAETVGLFNQV